MKHYSASNVMVSLGGARTVADSLIAKVVVMMNIHLHAEGAGIEYVWI